MIVKGIVLHDTLTVKGVTFHDTLWRDELESRFGSVDKLVFFAIKNSPNSFRTEIITEY